MANTIGNLHLMKELPAGYPIEGYSDPATNEPFLINSDNKSMYIYCENAGPHTIRIYQ